MDKEFFDHHLADLMADGVPSNSIIGPSAHWSDTPFSLERFGGDVSRAAIFAAATVHKRCRERRVESAYDFLAKDVLPIDVMAEQTLLQVRAMDLAFQQHDELVVKRFSNAISHLGAAAAHTDKPQHLNLYTLSAARNFAAAIHNFHRASYDPDIRDTLAQRYYDAATKATALAQHLGLDDFDRVHHAVCRLQGERYEPRLNPPPAPHSKPPRRQFG